MSSITERKEFYDLRYVETNNPPLNPAYNDYDFLKGPEADTLQLQSHQLFIRNLFNPHTKYKRLLLYHSTGTGKGLVIHSVAKMYIDYFKKMRQEPQVTIIGFTADILIKELLKFPEFGYITTPEKEEIDKLRFSKNERDKLRRRGMANITRNITDRSRGGYYKFFGSQKFALDLIIITPKGLEKRIDHKFIYSDEEGFEKRLEENIAEGNVRLNRSLIESLKYGFIACDEIHNAYNARSKNMRGIAIEYVLRLLEKEDPNSAPKVILASATPLTSSPMEIVDLMNLLIPNTDKPFQRLDFFSKNGELLPDALTRISSICAGYVSFLKDSNIKEYPKRLLEGVELLKIPYLRFTPCPMSKLMEDTVAIAKDIKDDDELDSLLSSSNYTLYDAVIPDPNKTNIGLYTSTKIIGAVSSASEEWKRKYGIDVDSDGNLTGEFMFEKNIEKYSPKAYSLLTSLINILEQKEPGKIIAYHYYVSIVGIMFLKEMLLLNGFLDASSAPISNTICSICGIQNQHHSKVKDHDFKPARVLTAYGDSGDLDKTLHLFDSSNNLYGYEYRILLGSRVINEGYDFKGVRFMFILSIPRDISTLIQVYGRAVRRYSHNMLPQKYRDTKIYTLVSTYNDKSKISPELLYYKRKMDVYIKIQKIEIELRKFAIDNFINYDKMMAGINLTVPSLDGLPFSPDPSTSIPEKTLTNIYKLAEEQSSTISTFTAYGYSIEEQKILILLIKKLFLLRAIWTYPDLLNAVRNPPANLKTAYDHSMFSEHNFALALDFLVTGTFIELFTDMNNNNSVEIPYVTLGGEQRRVIHQKPYFMLVPVDDTGFPIIDCDSFMRLDNAIVDTSLSLDTFVKTDETSKQFDKHITTFNKTYLKKIEMSLVELTPKFHNTIARIYIENDDTDTIKKIPKELIDIYKHIEFLLYAKDFQTAEVAKSYDYDLRNKYPIGFKYGGLAFIYISGSSKGVSSWDSIPISMFKSEEVKENDTCIGYSKNNTVGDIIFKIREPVSKLGDHKDRRKIRKGISCISADTSWKREILKELHIDVKKIKNNEVCELILKNLLDREIKSRTLERGRKRWYYFWFDNIPFSS